MSGLRRRLRRLLRRRLALAGGLALGAALLLPAGAGADFQGTDVFANVGPPSQVTDAGALVNRYPSGHYALDTHVDTGITNPSGLVGLIPHFLASQLWDLTKFLVLTTISLFTWAFSLDLLGGGSGPGALAPVSEAVERIYAHTFGAAWLAVGIVLAGLWGIWKAFVQRRYAETAGQLALSVGFVCLALFFVHSPERTLGRASEWTNQMSLAFLAGATDASVENPGRAKAEVADHLFRTLVHEPWVVLNFGGLRHCVDAEHRPVAPHSPARERCIDHLRSVGGRGGYAERFLRYPPGSEARNAEYEALKEGRIPGDDGLGDLLPGGDFLPGLPVLPGVGDTFSGILPGLGETSPDQFDGYRVDADDRPAADIQQQAAGFQRLTMAALIFAGDLGAVVLLGALAIAVILAQVFVLLFLAFAPLALVAGVFPGAGHALFQEWLRRLAGALVRKAFYSLVLAAVLAVGSALLAASDSLGWLYAFGLQAAFYWAVFLKRHSLGRRFATTAGAPSFDSHLRPVRIRRVGRLLEQAARPLRSRRHHVDRARSPENGRGRLHDRDPSQIYTQREDAERGRRRPPGAGKPSKERPAGPTQRPAATEPAGLPEQPPPDRDATVEQAAARTPEAPVPRSAGPSDATAAANPNRDSLERDLLRFDTAGERQPPPAGHPPEAAPKRRRPPRGA